MKHDRWWNRPTTRLEHAFTDRTRAHDPPSFFLSILTLPPHEMCYRVQPFVFPAQDPRPHVIPLVGPYFPLETTSHRAELDCKAALSYAEQAVTVFMTCTVDAGGQECAD